MSASGAQTAELKQAIETAWETRDAITASTTGAPREAVEAALTLLDNGAARVAERGADGAWTVNEWLKKAVLLSFRLNDMAPISGGPGGSSWWDKVPSKFDGWDAGAFAAAGFRAVPNAVVRRSAFIAKGVVLMPSFVNLGAYVDEGTMVDTWATVGSCAQIGKNCHISGGAGIGGVLEPLQAGPVIIEDDCFIGARSEVAEGVIVRTGAVLSMGVYIGASTKIVDRTTGETHIGEVPAYSVVVPGNLPGKPAAVGRAGAEPLLRRHRKARRRADALEDLDQRTAARLMTSPAPIDPVALTQALVRCASVTPEEGGALTQLERTLTPFGFACRRIDRGGVANLFAKWTPAGGATGPTLGFNGHTDVVPPGDPAAWRGDPFDGRIEDGRLWGRGAVDMKSGVAAFVAAACRFVAETPPNGSIALLITGDEEGPADHGTVALLDWMTSAGERLDHCLVGEPTSASQFGDVMKIGRRGSLTADIVATGVQGHTAYPQRAKNPLSALVRLLDRLASAALDEGTAHFEPSTLALTTIDTGNPAGNVIPAEARARLNIRFNDAQSSTALTAWIEREAREISQSSGADIGVSFNVSGEAFVTEPGAFTDLVADAVESVVGLRPQATTGGGTSDARFVKNHCPVVEFGLVGDTMHQIDERAPTADIERLAEVYRQVLTRYFESA